ncbi:VOC family protein [Nocardia sp. CDC159]|uniref:VOC family protein n=1 Tax=Nocardia pulmonis TaxID=2951408 RepID=A0A9X2E545_9NOCA|nr:MULTISPECIES: VOC family protein [Nocardia]MCM6773974.1 VOC family protein [Nocardia pulmonis]MCM6786861.1 VOC family protein [Nocardia sp. CDC159]
MPNDMPSEGPAVPILPARDLAATLAFYARLGFATESYDAGYGFVQRHAIELHFAATPEHDPWRSAGMAYVPIDDVDRVYAAFVAAGVWRTDSGDPPCTDAELRRRWNIGEGLARITPPEDKPWGIREFALMDPNNNLLRFGRSS